MRHLQVTAWRRDLSFAQWLGWIGPWLIMALAGLLALPVRAADAEDPPSRAGRLAELHGQVWIYATDSHEWISAARNRPVTTGDRISTEADGRAEVRIGSTVLRVAPNTELEVLRLDDDRVNVQLHSGSMSARLRTREAADEFSLRTDEGRFRTERPGQYRFDRVDDTTSATVVSGLARYEHEGTALNVQPGQRVEFWKERGGPQYSITEPRRDEFSNWVASLEGRDERSVSSRYVSPEMTGVEDLDRYGRWEPETEYGAVWIPRTVVAGWAPYRMGHWAWVSPWGWTWVDDAPWGFAPFHYGRWVWYRNGWCWAPGRYVARPVYAPALVAWVGGPNVSVSVRVGGAPTVGWFPLGPREVYVPGYRVSPRYVRNVNVTHVTNITNVTTIINNPGQVVANTRYVNRGLARAVTVVPAQVVERRQPVAPAFSPVNERVVRDFSRERPRADAPVATPPRLAPDASRPAVDPRVSRPGAPRPVTVPGGNGRDSDRDRHPGRPAVVSPPAPQEPRIVQPPRAQEGREPRDRRDDRDDRQGRDGRDGRDGGRGRDAPVFQPAPAVQPSQPVAPGAATGGFRPNPPPPVVVTPREQDRGAPPAAREERRRQHHDVVPPPPARPTVQATPAPQINVPQVQAPQAQVAPAPAPQVVAPPRPQVVRPPVQPRPEAAPPAQPEVRQRGRVEERERPERGERGERGERR